MPGAIEWQEVVIALRRVGGIHTHPSDVPFSDGDMMWLSNPDSKKKFDIVATASFTYLLLRTDAEIPDAYQYIAERENRFSWSQWARYQLRASQTILERNKGLAQYCRFGLYRGHPGEPLMRLA